MHSSPPPFSFISCLPHIPGVISTGIIFVFTYMCTHFIAMIHPPAPFPNTSSLPLVSALPTGQDLYRSTVLQICRRKERKDKTKDMIF
jgi:hypothetical protein